MKMLFILSQKYVKAVEAAHRMQLKSKQWKWLSKGEDVRGFREFLVVRAGDYLDKSDLVEIDRNILIGRGIEVTESEAMAIIKGDGK